MRAREFVTESPGLAENKITEIGYAAELDDSNYSTDNLLKVGKVIGQIENHDVMMASSGTETVYFLVVHGEVASFLGFDQRNLKNIKNFTNAPGVVRALIGYLVHKEGKTINIVADEDLTQDGVKWLIHLIKSPRGLKIQDQTGNTPTAEVIWREWHTATKSGIPGPTSITISENSKFGGKLRENEHRRHQSSLLMPVNIYEIPSNNDLAEADYHMQHRPADKTSGSPMHDLSGTYPDDIYGPHGAQYHGHYGQNNPLDIAAIQKIRIARGDPKKAIQIYRAVPLGIKEIQPGDWVTTVKAYAKEHGSGWLQGKYKILSRVVKAGDLYTEGNSILEWGWDP